MIPKEMKVKFEEHQCEVRIPQKFRRILKITKGAKIAWSIDEARNELFGYLIKGDEDGIRLS